MPELGLEAICDLLRKHGRPVGMRDAFKRSAGERAREASKAPRGKSRSGTARRASVQRQLHAKAMYSPYCARMLVMRARLP